jgi:hypothetical protein
MSAWPISCPGSEYQGESKKGQPPSVRSALSRQPLCSRQLQATTPASLPVHTAALNKRVTFWGPLWHLGEVLHTNIFMSLAGGLP